MFPTWIISLVLLMAVVVFGEVMIHLKWPRPIQVMPYFLAFAVIAVFIMFAFAVLTFLQRQ